MKLLVVGQRNGFHPVTRVVTVAEFVEAWGDHWAAEIIRHGDIRVGDCRVAVRVHEEDPA